MTKFYLLLGSNIGDRKKNLLEAQTLMTDKGLNPVAVSSIYETEAWGLEDQPDFLNQACIVESSMDPLTFLQKLKEIEKTAGRQKSEKWGPRIIDIDILYADDNVISTPELKIPHPDLYSRNFALIPMIEIAGELVDPVKQLTLDELYDLCTDTKEVYLYEED